MSLAGEGLIAIWNGVAAEARDDTYEWHNREHMPERVGIAGFRRGRRYRAIDADIEYFTLYETDTPLVHTGSDYTARLNAPTPWTQRSIRSALDTSRSLCRVAASFGVGQGGLLVTYRYDVAPEREDAHRDLLAHVVLPLLADAPGVVGVHLAIADRAASAVETAEKKDIAKPLVPNWVILVEGGSEAAPLLAACDVALPEGRLIEAGAIAPVRRGLYQLQFTRLKTARSAG
ncbi:MAG TPA: hypothetical protein VJK90_08775 [Acetobacteraceae bacterium]|jgi:hypothetical protein|nr:hypothetical protein [Acetobacteraceae bacterium]